MHTTNQNILDSKISALPFSDEFLKASQESRLTTLSDLLAVPSHKLLKLEGFDERSIRELIFFLSKFNMELLLRP